MEIAPGLSTDSAVSLDTGWRLTASAADAWTNPADAAAHPDWIEAPVPGTAAQALSRAGLWSAAAPHPLHDRDFWYRRPIALRRGDRLAFEGLVTIAEVWLGDRFAGRSESMFVPLEIEADDDFQGEVFICFRSLNRALAERKGKRARWRTALVENQSLRFVRTTLLGHMTGWCPPIDIVGPYRPVRIKRARTLAFDDVKLSASLAGSVGILEARIDLPPESTPRVLSLVCAGASADFERTDDGLFARLELPNVNLWWPHSHGEPALYEAALRSETDTLAIGKVGFRTIVVDKGPDGGDFRFVVNGEPMFMRGVCWTPSDLVTLPCDYDVYRRELSAIKAAGCNMARIPGILLYESREFFRAADELGVLIWQDLQLANFDYPFADGAFRELVEREVDTFVASSRGHCSLAVVCGGSEIMQQAAMLGLPASVWRSDFLESALEARVRTARDDVAYVANSPFGGVVPFAVDRGVAHYYGVGAYMRPLEDARRARVSFAAECLAFANAPDAVTLEQTLPVAPVHHPQWKARVPRDRGASWDFEDVREYYMNLLYGIDSSALRRENPSRYLAYARAATAETIEAVFAEWRRPQSRTAGGLVFLWKDFWPGAGWGVMDSTGRPKSAWYALKRAFRPLQVVTSDEGVNGLHVHAINETPTAVEVVLEIECLARRGVCVASGRSEFSLAPRSARSLNACELFGAFFDANYAYRFGPPAHEVVAARLRDRINDDILCETFHFPLGRSHLFADPQVAAEWVETDDGPGLRIACEGFAQTLAIECGAFVPQDNYFHLAPGSERIVRLDPPYEGASRPSIVVSALNSGSAATV